PPPVLGIVDIVLDDRVRRHDKSVRQVVVYRPALSRFEYPAPPIVVGWPDVPANRTAHVVYSLDQEVLSGVLGPGDVDLADTLSTGIVVQGIIGDVDVGLRTHPVDHLNS